MPDGAAPRREIWVVCERRYGRLFGGSCELIGKAAELARSSGMTAAAVLVGAELDGSVKDAAAAGAETVYTIAPIQERSDDDVSFAVSDLAAEYKPEIVLMSSTIRGRSVAPQIAARLRTGLAADCLKLSFDAGGRLLATRPAYGDRFAAEVVCHRAFPQMATVRPGVFKLPELSRRRECRIVSVTPKKSPSVRFRLLSIAAGGGDRCGLQDARVIVAGGKGVGSAAGFRKLEELAVLLGGVTGASRSAVDAGYAPYEMQIGQSGKIVHPKVYLAFGISGSIQHLAGMSLSGFILAVNNDRKAPIFDHADYGILGDVSLVVEELLRHVRRFPKSPQGTR